MSSRETAVRDVVIPYVEMEFGRDLTLEERFVARLAIEYAIEHVIVVEAHP